MIEVLCQLQVDSGLECPPLTRAIKRVGDIPKFDNKVCLVVTTTILSTEIRSPIPNAANIFVNDTSKLDRSKKQLPPLYVNS